MYEVEKIVLRENEITLGSDSLKRIEFKIDNLMRELNRPVLWI